jgi:hypothetical protein
MVTKSGALPVTILTTGWRKANVNCFYATRSLVGVLAEIKLALSNLSADLVKGGIDCEHLFDRLVP